MQLAVIKLPPIISTYASLREHFTVERDTTRWKRLE